MIKLLLDMGLPRRAASDLNADGWDICHIAALGMSTATDEEIVDLAAREGRVIVTLDSDFGRILAERKAKTPSVIYLRIAPVGRQLAVDLLREILFSVGADILDGCVAVVTRGGIRVRRLPIH
jgi:predicted nuclease of predicted toxin-antitoxin system